MSGMTTTAAAFCAPPAAWPLTGSAGASAAALVNPVPGVSGTNRAKHAQKRFTMAGTDIYGWPLGPRDWTSG